MDNTERDIDDELYQIVNRSRNHSSDEITHLNRFVEKYNGNYIMSINDLHDKVLHGYSMGIVKEFYQQSFNKKKYKNYIKKYSSQLQQQYNIDYRYLTKADLIIIHKRIFKELNIDRLKKIYNHFFNRNKFTHLISEVLTAINIVLIEPLNH